jgi:hypothetical protein
MPDFRLFADDREKAKQSYFYGYILQSWKHPCWKQTELIKAGSMEKESASIPWLGLVHELEPYPEPVPGTRVYIKKQPK